MVRYRSKEVDPEEPVRRMEPEEMDEAVNGKLPPWLREVLEWVKALAIALVITILLRNFVVDLVRVDGASMQPTLATDERLMINRFEFRIKEPKRGQVIVCSYPNHPGRYVKRVIGLPGETIRVTDGTTYINDVPLDEPYILEEPVVDFPAFVIPEGSVFVMGDNRNDSMDSRAGSVGPIELKRLRGPAFAIVWPFNRLEWLAVPTY